jgi:hypothetical protein
MRTVLVALALSAACLSGAHADPLGELIQFRTAKAGETCTRHSATMGVCTIGKAMSDASKLTAIFYTDPIFKKYGAGPETAKFYCDMAAKKLEQEIYAANFFTYQGERMLNAHC